MKKILLVIPALIILVIALGPSVRVDEDIKAITIPDDIDLYLKESESKFKLKPENEKKVIWAYKDKRKTDVSIIYIHGFGASRNEISPVTQRIAARMNANLFFTRLKGHGCVDADEMGRIEVNDLFNDTYEAMKIGQKIGNKQIVIGTSTGVPLILWYVNRYKTESHEISHLVFISPNFGVKNPMAGILTWPWGEKIAELIMGKYRSWEPKSELQKKYWISRYPSKATPRVIALVKYVENMSLQDITIPTIFFYTEHDYVLNVDKILETYTRYGSPVKKRINVKESKEHVLAGDSFSPHTTDAVVNHVLEFIKSSK